MPARQIAPSVNISAESGHTVNSALSNWLTTIDNEQIEHLAGTTHSSELVHFFYKRGAGKWQAENLKTLTGYEATGQPVAWVTSDGLYTVEHIAASDPRDHLLVYYRSTKTNVWKVVDVTAKTGRTVVGGLSTWQTPNGQFNVEHLSGHNRQGNLSVFWWSPQKDWQSVSVTDKTGIPMHSDVCNWQVRRNDHLNEYVAGVDMARGRVIVFSWTPQTDWQVQVTDHRATDGLCAWVTDGNVEHIGGVQSDGRAFVLWRSNTPVWVSIDLSRITSQRAVPGTLMPYQLQDGAETVEFLGAIGSEGRAIVYWWKPSRDWQALDLSDLSGHRFDRRPATWNTKASVGRTSEHFASIDTSGNVRVVYSYDQPRIWTDTVGAPYKNIPRQRGVRRRVLTILWDPHYPGIPKPNKTDVISQLADMRRYFVENSGGTFQLEDLGTLGWYDAEQPLEYYDNSTMPHDKAGAAIRAAAADFNFAAYDTDGNGVLDPSELAIVFAHPGRSGGLYRNGSREVRDIDGSPLIIGGVRIKECVEVGIGHPQPSFSVIAHELCHGLFNSPDMYFGFFTPTEAGMYSLMDSTYDKTHLDAFQKLKLGWAYPRLVMRSSTVTIPDVETRRRVLVLVDTDRSLSEYFLVENRWRGNSFDVALFDQGLAVWHIMEVDSVFNAAPPPITVDAAKWNEIGQGTGAEKVCE